MPTARRLFALVFALAGPSALAGPINIYTTGFENPPFTADSPLVGQDGWVGVPILSPNSATVTNTLARSGLQSIQARGADLVSSGGLTGPYDAAGSYRRPFNFTVPAGTPLVRMEADMRIDGPRTTTTNDFFSLTLTGRTTAGDTLREFGLSADGTAVGYKPGGALGGPADFTAPIQLGQWYRVALEMNSLTGTTSYLLDGVLIGSVNAPWNSNVFQRGSFVLYARPDGGTDARANYTARFDNFSVTANEVPEPAGLLLVGGLVATGGLVVRRRKA